ncbi:MAG: hypothetical protein KGQ59_10045 [Bdellovibrionales bacterium]|nr:hypothetical protein [Bdellovibrionales bacterium]
MNMRTSRVLSILTFITTMAVLLPSMAHATSTGSSAPAGSVAVPCGDPSTGLSDCKEVKERSKKLVFARVKEIVDCWYGKGANCDGISSGFSRICNLIGGSLTPSEMESNHVGQSCGAWSEVKTEYKVSGGLQPRVDSESQVISSGGKGDRERAYVAGGYINATECALRRVLRMIDSGSLSVSACKAAGQDLASVQGSFTAAIGRIGGANALKIENKRELLDKCDGKTQKVVEKQYSKEMSNSADAKAESLDQKNCRLATQRSGAEAMFQHLAVCEIMAQVEPAYNRFVMSSMSPGVMQGRIDGWVKKCKGCMNDDQCQNECYQKNFLEYIRGQLGSAFGSCG